LHAFGGNGDLDVVDVVLDVLAGCGFFRRQGIGLLAIGRRVLMD